MFSGVVVGSMMVMCTMVVVLAHVATHRHFLEHVNKRLQPSISSLTLLQLSLGGLFIARSLHAKLCNVYLSSLVQPISTAISRTTNRKRQITNQKIHGL